MLGLKREKNYFVRSQQHFLLSAIRGRRKEKYGNELEFIIKCQIESLMVVPYANTPISHREGYA